MKTKYKMNNIISALLVLMVSVLSYSCDDDANLNPAIDVMVSENTDLNINSGKPNDLIIAEGNDLQDVKTVTFRALSAPEENIVDVVFNPVLNSKLAIMFNVPFDETKGSEFGAQVVTITNKDGDVITHDFNLIQPEPTIGVFSPERPKANETVSISGEWFQNVISVSFAGSLVDYTIISSTEISIVVPDGTVLGSDVTIVTDGGEVTAFLDIDIGYNLYLVADFDGGGLRPNNNWITYGDAGPLDYVTGGPSGTFAQFQWLGDNSNGYNGCQSDATETMVVESDPEKVMFLIDVNCNGKIGSVAEFLIVDRDGGNWAFRHEFTEDGWHTIETPVAAFGANYDPENQGSGDVDPTQINQVKVTIAEWGANPSTVQFDNIRFHGFY
ncbi:IPT/TIG domain-containing protein [Labilibaculum filiforme]|nr:IPT/TIG domain-containing protein [Labilibaculum filiforme]